MNKAIGKATGELLYTARKLKDLSPEEASSATGDRVSASYIRRIEKGINSPSIEIVELLCGVYGTTLADFFATLEERSA